MKFKLLALAAMMAVGGAANAAIDTGAEGNGELFFNIWDANSSYTVDLNSYSGNTGAVDATIDGLEAAIAAPGGINWNFAADSLLTSFLSSANFANLSWNVTAADSSGGRRLVNTFTTLPATTLSATLIRTAVGTTQSLALAVNQTLATTGGDSAVSLPGTPGYVGAAANYGTNAGVLNFNVTGSQANDSYASGLNMLRINGNASGTTAGTYNPYGDDGFAVRAHFDTDTGTFMISAVPEPETYALMLAGLALMGGIARRRQNKA